MTKTYLIYGLRCPKTDDYRYIGKSSSGINRAKSHLTYSHNESVNHWVLELREEGLAPLVDVIEECQESELVIKEHFWIQYYQRVGCVLFNHIKYKGKAIEGLEKEVDKEESRLNDKISLVRNLINGMSCISEFIKYRRKQLNISQQELADLAKISRVTIHNMENKDKNSTISNIETVLDILGCELMPLVKTPRGSY